MCYVRAEKRVHFYTALLIGVWVMIDRLIDRWIVLQGKGVVNPGGVGGFFPNIGWWWVIWVIILLVIIDRWWRSLNKVEVAGWSIILAGGLANLVDRLMYGGVLDYIYYPLINVYGNIADILLGLGVGILLMSLVRQRHLA